MTYRELAETAAQITEEHAPPALREHAYLRAVTALREGRDPHHAVRTFVQENM